VTDAALAERLLERTLELVRTPSVGRDDAAILAHMRASLPTGFEVVDDEDAAFLAAPPADGRPLVVLVGHVDTVPPSEGERPSREGGAVVGRGAADMKGGLAVMLEVAAEVDADVDAADARNLACGLVVVGREELPITESALVPLLERSERLREAALAIVLEPTGNALELGCMGNLNARVTVEGKAGHSARPWLGDNAIHKAITALGSIADLPVRDVEVEGLVFREVVSITTFSGGVAQNVIPDRVEAHVNLRYAPNHTPEEAEARLRELLGHRDVAIEIVGNAPPAPVALSNPLVRRLRDVGGLDVRPKQAWTPVAELAMFGIDAVNLGPGDPRYAHADDERVEADALVRTYDVLRRFLAGPSAT
jgi:succinyl-diaminopimelate desuccinylase